MFVTQPKVFISSTIKDLPNERIASLKAVERCGAFPVMSEFTIEAQNADSVTACLDKVKNSDIYILILGERFGWQPYEKESITELEFDTALKNKIPILVFNTTYPKETLQKDFEKKVETSFFRKTVKDAFELQDEIEKSLKIEIDKKQSEFFNKTEKIYSNLVKIEFPRYLYKAELNIDKKNIKISFEERGMKLKFKASLFDYVLASFQIQDIRFSGDWILWENSILTFHDLHDSRNPLRKVIDTGTIEKLACDEIYNISQDVMSVFKHLLKKCLEAKLYKLKIKWLKSEGMFAFIPTQKDNKGRWLQRNGEWTKGNKKATRKVVDIKNDLKDKDKIFNMRCMAFRTRFENFDDLWYISIKPEWVFLWPDLKVCDMAFKNVQWLKKTERNLHVFNHFYFILKYLQPQQSESLFPELTDYPYLKFGEIEVFDFAPFVPDNQWLNLESEESIKKIGVQNDNAELLEL